MNRVGGKIQDAGDLGAVDLGGRVRGVGGDELFDLSRAFGTIHRQRFTALEVDAKLGEDAVEKANECEALGFRVSGGLGDEDGGGVAILVPHKIRCAVAVALLSAEDIEARVLEAQAARLLLGESGVVGAQSRRNGGLVVAELLADVFETGERLHAAQTEFFRNRFLKIGGDECLDDHAARAVRVIEDSEFKKPRGPIPSEDRADLVARNEVHFAFRIPRGNSHAVVIRVGGDDKVRAGEVGLGDRHAERLGIFRIRRLHRREASIGNFLLGHAVALESEPL